MTPDEVEEIRADIWAEPWTDPSLFPDLLNRAVTELGKAATGGIPDPVPPAWAATLLRVLQRRAKSGIPFGEPPPDEAPYWSEHL